MPITKTLSLFLLSLVVGATGFAQLVKDRHVAAELVSEFATVEPGQIFHLALRLVHDPHWHTYYQNPGTGYATSLTWNDIPAQIEVSGIKWPTPDDKKFGEATIYAYEGETLLLFEVYVDDDLAPGTTLTFSGYADWLMCREVCIPGGADVQTTVRIAESATPSEWADDIAGAVAALPDESNAWTAKAWKDGDDVTLTLEGPGGIALEDPVFIADEPFILPDAEQIYRQEDGRHVLQLTWSNFPEAEGVTELAGLVRSDSGWGEGFPSLGLRISPEIQDGSPGAIAATPETSGSSFLLILGAAFLGGLILNLMPCVFPVLGLKVMGFVQQAGEDRKKVVSHGLIFTLGVLVSFWVLAAVLLILRAGGQELGWGFQLQEPGFVFFLAALLLVFGLNLSGVFELGGSLVGAGSKLQAKSGYGGSFFSGVLATVVATPCAAPFLAPALGAALSVNAFASLVLFTMIALGLASPYLLLSAFPSAIKVLPRPGAWMETFRQVMAFPLYATVGFLLYVLSTQLDPDAFLDVLLALTVLAMATWIYGRWNAPGRPQVSQRVGLASAVVVFAIGLWMGLPRGPEPVNVEAGEVPPVRFVDWSEAKVEELVAAGTPVFVDFTASWCVTCKVNKRVVFGSEEVNRQFYEKGVVALKADWSRSDPAITQALAEHGRSAVPFNLMYLPGRDEPVALPEVLTPGIVLEKLEGLPVVQPLPEDAEVARL